MTWDGSAITTPTDLCTTAQVKTHLGITGSADDVRIAALIPQVTDLIAQRIGRSVMSASYEKWLDGNGHGSMFTREIPLTAVSQLSLGSDVGLKVICEATDATHATVKVTSTGVVCKVTDGASAGTNTLLFATYTTLTLLAAAIEALDGDWDVTIEGDYGSYRSSQLREMPEQFCHDDTALLYIPEDPEFDYVYDGDTGEIILGSGVFPTGNRNIYIAYTAGETSVPDDINLVAIRTVGYLFQQTAKLQAGLVVAGETYNEYTWRSAGGSLRQGLDDILADLAPRTDILA